MKDSMMHSSQIMNMLRSQIMSRAEHILGNKLFHHKFTQKIDIFFLECKLIMISTCTAKNQSIM